MTGYKNLEAWKKAMLLVKEVYELTKGFQKEELYGISSQAKRAAVSIPSNIADGCGRQYKRDTRHFCILPEDHYINWDSFEYCSDGQYFSR
jgi:hypothetical protein